MEKVLVVYASRMGSTAEIARAIGDQLTQRGLEVDVRPATEALDARKYRAVTVGSAVYLRHWDRDAIHYLKNQAPDLAERPTWFFQSGPCGPAEEQRIDTPHIVARLGRDIGAQPLKTFGGNLDRSRATTWLARRVATGDLAGDFRDWDEIRAWANGVADAVKSAPS